MDVFKFMCKRIYDEEDAVMFADGSQIRKNCDGANKKRKSSDDPLDTSNAPQTEEKLSNGDDNNCNKVEKVVKSNMSPSQGTTTQFACHQVVLPKQIVQSERQNTLPNQSIQQVEVPKQVKYMRQANLQLHNMQQANLQNQSILHKQLQHMGQANLQQLQNMQQANLQNQSILPKQLQYLRQANLQLQYTQQANLTKQSIQQVSVSKQLQNLRQTTLPNQSIQQVAVPKQTVQSVRQDTFPNQSIRNEVAKVEKRGPQSYEILSWEPRAFLYHNFLSEEECGHLIKLATPLLKRSQTNDRITGERKVTCFRTSFGASLKRGSDEIIRNIEKRIAETTFMPIEHGEPLHVLRYEVGQKIEPHYDYFDFPNLSTASWGQRIATFLMYLSAAEEGGETIFPSAKGNITSVPWCDGLSKQVKKGVVVRPKMGDAVLFWSVKPDGTLDPSSLHGGVPVIKGNKWCCTKWMRAKEIKV